VSDCLFATRLRWYGVRGVAKLHWQWAILTSKPKIDGLEFDELDYTPEVGVRLIRDPKGKMRDMEPHEIAACDAFLRAQTFHQGES
jgi:hypothetical protein